jgi:crooked neck
VQRPGGSGRSGRATQVKNRSPAPVQITAEQILREAHEFREAEYVKPPQQAIVDAEELAAYRFDPQFSFVCSFDGS